MPAVWLGLKRSLKCKSQRTTDVHDPERNGNKSVRNISTKKKSSGGRSGCSRSIANLKDVMIHGSKRHTEKPPICSPRSIGSSELLNPITHEVVVDDSTCELRISGMGRGRILASPVRRTARRSPTRPRCSFGGDSHGALFCHKCGDQFVRWEAVEAHHLSKHAGKFNYIHLFSQIEL